MAQRESYGRDEQPIDELLDELAELRELDRRRQAHAPGSPAHDAASLEVDLRSRRLMDRFRDLKSRRWGAGAGSARKAAAEELGATRPLDARTILGGPRLSRLN